MQKQQERTGRTVSEAFARDESIASATQFAFRQTQDALQAMGETLTSMPGRILGCDQRDLRRNLPSDVYSADPELQSTPVLVTTSTPTVIPQATSPSVSATVQVTLTEPPRFKEDRYELLRKELYWWRDINAGVAESRLCAMELTEEQWVDKWNQSSYQSPNTFVCCAVYDGGSLEEHHRHTTSVECTVFGSAATNTAGEKGG